MRQLLSTDEGAARLGEVALVSEGSLVSSEHRTFYSTLIDENASCHLALGRAYPVTLRGGAELGLAEFEAAGGNHSQVHLDFMVGSPQLQVTALGAGGRWVTVMRRGTLGGRAAVTTGSLRNHKTIKSGSADSSRRSRLAGRAV